MTTPFGDFTRKTIVVGDDTGVPTLTEPAYLRFGPDGRLYVTSYTGSLFAITLNAEHKAVAVQETKPFGDRLLTGMAFDRWASPSEPVLYLVNNDPPIYSADDFTGRVSRLDFASGEATDLIVGLPRSFENHMTFDMEFGADRGLYIAQGGNTNNGAPAPGPFGNRPERPLSAALLRADVRSASFSGIDDVEVYAPGFRNAYGLCLHSNGYLYVEDQGSNRGFGGRPTASGGTIEVFNNLPDELNVVLPDRYYGHPNPSRDQYAFHEDLPDGTLHQEPVTTFPLFSVVTGLVEYDSPANGGGLLGSILLAGFYNHSIVYVQLADDGMTSTGQGTLADGFVNPIDVAVGADGTIYVLEAGASLAFGGTGPSRVTALIPAEPALGTWTSRANLPAGPRRGAAAALGAKVYWLAEPDDEDDTGSALSAYDPATDTWVSLAPFPGTAARDRAMAGENGRVYVFGGLMPDGATALSETWSYDPQTNAWLSEPAMPTARGACAVAASDDRIYVIGGHDAADVRGEVDVFVIAERRWEDADVAPAMPTSRADLAATLAPNGLIYCVGGRESIDGSPVATVDAFDPVEGRWITGYSPLPEAVAGHVASALLGRIVVAGGYEGTAHLSDDVYEYDTVTDTWRSLASLSADRAPAAAAVVSNRLLLLGGVTGDADDPTDAVSAFLFLP